jgi:hypothetical protein
MTTQIKAVGTYRPRIRLGRTANRQDLVDLWNQENPDEPIP